MSNRKDSTAGRAANEAGDAKVLPPCIDIHISLSCIMISKGAVVCFAGMLAAGIHFRGCECLVVAGADARPRARDTSNAQEVELEQIVGEELQEGPGTGKENAAVRALEVVAGMRKEVVLLLKSESIVTGLLLLRILGFLLQRWQGPGAVAGHPSACLQKEIDRVMEGWLEEGVQMYSVLLGIPSHAGQVDKTRQHCSNAIILNGSSQWRHTHSYSCQSAHKVSWQASAPAAPVLAFWVTGLKLMVMQGINLADKHWQEPWRGWGWFPGGNERKWRVQRRDAVRELYKLATTRKYTNLDSMLLDWWLDWYWAAGWKRQ
ncbi:hypothetical protein B0H19DRAFT_1077270 [Mycena capillaripes]|nr:hypothetical protein B0H19DRAFT_1077270 [Mycena capillaripes]